MKIKLLALILLTLSFLSCKKEEKETDPIILLTSKPWKPIQNGNVVWNHCDKDNTYTFGTNQLTIDKGTNKCTSFIIGEIEADTETVDYQVDFTNKTLSYKGATYKIEEISDKHLILYAALPHSSGFTGIRFPFEH